MKKICVAITARPSYSRIKSALQYLNADPKIELQILCSGSALLERYGRVVSLIKNDGFNVIDELYTFVEGDEPINMALTVSNTINQSALALRRIDPEIIVTIADRYETLGTAIAASYMGIPLVHIQGGEVSGNIDERVRHSITKLADYHLVANKFAERRVAKMGENPSSIIVTGCPSIDIARESNKIDLKCVQEDLNKIGVGAYIDLNKDFIIVLQHPDTNTFNESYNQIRKTLNSINNLKIPTIIFWPNVDAGSDATSKCIREYRETNKLENVRFLKNLEGKIFLRLLSQAKCLVGNSSVGLRECSYLGVPVVNIGMRQSGRDRGANVIDVNHNQEDISNAILIQISHGKYPSSELYGNGYSGRMIADTITQFTPSLMGKTFHEG